MAAFIGLMSGTSLDGVDAVLVRFTEDAAHTRAGMHVEGHVHRAFEEPLRQSLLRLQTAGDNNELHTAALAANGVARSYAACVEALLLATHADPASITALGAHGQTVRHRPGEFDGDGYTLQLLNGALLAELAGIDVVCDLRSRDVAAGGQGAPLVPAFHDWAFGETGTVERSSRAVLNLGGMANLSLLPKTGHVLGFDTGPGGALLDAWYQQHMGKAYDDSGAWGATGRLHAGLLNRMLGEAYFLQPPPKSTGRDTFHLAWVESHVKIIGHVEAVDVQATLAELTAASVSDALLRHAPDAAELIVCGGGARNDDILTRLGRHLPGLRITTSAEHGIPVDQVEALAFAWLAQRFVQARTGNLPAVTGARGPRRLGALYPGR